MKSVVVLMSGGVDSTVAAYLLKNQGCEVIGVTLKFREYEGLSDSQKQRCCYSKDIYDVKHICSLLGIKHFVLDICKEFEERVVQYFCNEYNKGYTPNPCIVCNKEIKFNLVYEKVKKMFGVTQMATGHYAKIMQKGNEYFIAMANDRNKDQSYFLSMIGWNNLKNFLFPLGDKTKSEVRDIAKSIGLDTVAKKKDSYEICFVPTKNYREFLLSRGIEVENLGVVREVNSKKIVGQHSGFINYTIGQRSGLKLEKINKKKYVVKIDASENVVYIGDEQDLYKKTLIATELVVYDKYLFGNKLVNNKKSFKKFFGKIRYKTPLVECNIDFINVNKMIINFVEPQRAITPGQFVVIYDEENKIVCAGKILEFR